MPETQENAAPAQAQEPADQQQNQSQATATEAPPWGGDFDAEKAWKLVQNLRADKEKLSARPALTEAQQQQLDEYNALVEASKSEAQRKDEAAATAQRERDEAKAEASIYKVAIRHGISEEDFDLLGTGSEEQIEARAVKIAAKNEAAKQAALEAAVQAPNTPSPRRPTEQLRPGVSPSSDPVQDESHYPSDWLSPSQRASLERARNS